MTTSLGLSLDRTLEILHSSQHSLKDLADLSGYDRFHFYQGASLASLNLSDQDLTGLNFDRADLRDCNLKGVKFDVGAFNGSLLSDTYKFLKDDFDSYLMDLDMEELERIYVFIKFREESLEAAIRLSEMSYQGLAALAGISEATLRKARRSEAVSWETAAAVGEALQSRPGRRSSPHRSDLETILRHPMIKFVSVRSSGGFSNVERKTLYRLVALVREMSIAHPDRLVRQKEFRWKDGPEMIYLLAGIAGIEAPLQYQFEQPDLFIVNSKDAEFRKHNT